MTRTLLLLLLLAAAAGCGGDQPPARAPAQSGAAKHPTPPEVDLDPTAAAKAHRAKKR